VFGPQTSPQKSLWPFARKGGTRPLYAVITVSCTFLTLILQQKCTYFKGNFAYLVADTD
jgi:hypothetical protein